jgi:coenzyme F420-reducing hydrogenase beta subunit
MSEDKEGFYYPLVDKDKCIDCHLCEKVCPNINVEPEIVNEDQKGYLLQLRDDNIREQSTSGGAFTAIATWVIAHGGVVFGAALNVDTFEVYHTYTDRLEGLEKFRISKYVQSQIYDSYVNVKNYLAEGRWVCFSGTPCQIEGLHHFLKKKQWDKLILVDVVCYGIPSPGLFRSYMQWKQQIIGGKFKTIFFREKLLSYNYTSFSAYNEDSNKDYHKGVESEQFMRSFFSDINVRPSCYACPFKKRYRVSDFTLWDCYDVKKFSREFDDNGTNRVLVHTEKGDGILSEIKNIVKLERYYDIDYFIKDEVAMTKSVPMNANRANFFADYQTLSMKNLMEKWFPMTLKVRINTILRILAFKLGIYNQSKRIVKSLIGKK